MRHRVRARKLSRTSSHRVALYRNLVTSLLEHERVETTDIKAKEVRRLADRMITLGKRGDLHARRRALRVIRRREVAAKVFDDLAERFRDRPGGYTRVLKLGNRTGDAAPISLVELVESAPKAPEEKKPRARKARARKADAEASEKSGTKKASGKKDAGKKAAQPAKKTSTSKTRARKTSAKQSD